ncbi:MAG: YggT family protein [Acidimicrobiaceae bacterium]|nr:YggT family protein [Acidimicrobiaceae bacterium]
MILVHDLISLYILILIVSALLSWFPTTNSSGALATTKRVLYEVSEPVLRPLRMVLPRPQFGGVGIDLSVLVAIILLSFINRII